MDQHPTVAPSLRLTRLYNDLTPHAHRSTNQKPNKYDFGVSGVFDLDQLRVEFLDKFILEEFGEELGLVEKLGVGWCIRIRSMILDEKYLSRQFDEPRQHLNIWLVHNWFLITEAGRGQKLTFQKPAPLKIKCSDIDQNGLGFILMMITSSSLRSSLSINR